MVAFDLKNYDKCDTRSGILLISDFLSSFSSDQFIIFEGYKLYIVGGSVPLVPRFSTPLIPFVDLSYVSEFLKLSNLHIFDTSFGLVACSSLLSVRYWYSHTSPSEHLNKYYVCSSMSLLSPFFDTYDEAFNYLLLNFDSFPNVTFFIFQTTEFDLRAGKVNSNQWFFNFIVIPFPCCELDYSPIVKFLGGTPA